MYLTKQGLEWDYSTWEDESYTFLASYYEVSMVSLRSALLHSSEIESTSDVPIGPRLKAKDLFRDAVHPTDLGYALWSQALEFALCEQFRLIDNPSFVSENHQDSQWINSFTKPREVQLREVQLPPAVFSNPAHQLALRRGSELSGFSKLEESINMSDVPQDMLPEGTNASSLDSEMRVTLLPLLVLEGCAWFGVGQASTLAPSPRDLGADLHTFALEPFRFLGVFHIVLMHEAAARMQDFWWRIPATFGKYWVQFFFVLSGFALYISQRGAPEVSNPGSFIMKRVCGIYPAYLIGTIVALAVAEVPLQATWNYLFRDSIGGFLLVDSWTFPYGSQSPDGPAWFACTLLAFWLCFPHWYQFLHGLSSPKVAMVFAYLSTFGLPVLYAVKNLDCGRSITACTLWGQYAECVCAAWGPFVEFHPLSNWQTFFFGMCLGRILQDCKPEDVPVTLRKAAAMISFLILVSVPMLLPVPSNNVSTLFFDKGPLLLPSFASLIYFTALGEDALLKPAILENQTLQYLGSVSGHLFLLHWPVRLLVARMSAGAAPVYLTVTLQLIVAIAVYEAQKKILGPLRSGWTGQSAGIDNLQPVENDKGWMSNGIFGCSLLFSAVASGERRFS